MTDEPSQALSIEVSGSGAVSALLTTPAAAHAAYVLAHGAGAGMHHPFMAAVASGLARRGVATLRFQFPSMERASRRPDPPRVAHAAVRAAVAEANRRLGGLPLFAGGKSFGGRMTSQAQADAPLPGVAGLVFLGFPLHPAGRPGDERGEHLARVACPMLFVQGSRDELADVALVAALVDRLGTARDAGDVRRCRSRASTSRPQRQQRRRGARAPPRHDRRMDGARRRAPRSP